MTITFFACTIFLSDHFIGEWIQVNDFLGNDIKKGDTAILIRITKQDIFYLVEVNRKGKYEPYPDQSGRYKLSDDKINLVSVAFGKKFSIQYRDDSKALFENTWLGYFKKK